MTELLSGAAEVRHGGDPLTPAALRTAEGWRRVERVVARWVVDSGWWDHPIRREYLRCLLEGGECCEVYRDLDTGSWAWSRRYD